MKNVNEVARFNNPIIAVKKVEANEEAGNAAYEKVHILSNLPEAIIFQQSMF